ncbi:MAG: heme ABC transporter ATP-binding protein [Coprobacillus sp. 28_7]|nr:MAG: heme ABC transporter ATP-binding protein [Coprobacillus sp. 28_7]CCY08381.1 aBC transporter related protein [Coprobacillus sp. CAG:698]
MSEYVIEMLNICKSFGSLKANDDITIQLKKGEIHALLGENGAGKSTLMSILFGLNQMDSGVIKKNGKVVNIKSPNDATKLRIGMVHQHFKLVDIFTVLDNIILGAEPCGTLGFIKRKEAREKIFEVSKRYGLLVDLDKKIEDISVGMQQRVEILKMLYRENDILIFDEPTAVLTPQEIEELLKIMKNLANDGKSILFITHKLNEIKEVADRVSILRKGKYMGTYNVSEKTVEELSELMVGRKVSLTVDKKDIVPTEAVLEVKDLTMFSKGHSINKINKYDTKNLVNEVSFSVRGGEIVCITGIDGNGQSDLVYGITGLEKINSGRVLFKGVDITDLSIRKKSIMGMSHIPEDRQKHGLVLGYTMENNLILQRYFEPQFTKMGFLRKKEIREYANKLIDAYDIRSGEGAVNMVSQMSGGNQQKVIIAREIDKDPDILIAVQPTRGLDVGAIEFIHKKIVSLRDAGKAVLVISLELEEVMSIADRILVMHNGEIVGELNPKETTVQEIGLYMSGAKRNR